ncbi:hypothetical protein D3C83_42260 [compost metagenome]
MLTFAMVLNNSSASPFGEPTPAEPKLSCPGRALASAINSFTFFAGSDGWTAIALG